MAELPRYKRLGIQAAQPGNIDFADSREAARVGQTISQQVDRMAAFVYKQESAKAEQRGAQAVQDLGAQTVLQRLGAAGGPSTIAERSAYNTANRIYATEVETMARARIGDAVNQAQLNNEPLEIFKGRLNEIVDGFPAALSDVDAAVAGELRAKLSGVAMQAGVSYSGWIGAKAQEALQGQALQGIAQRQSDIYSFARADMNPEDREAALGLEMFGLAEYMRDRNFDEAQISKALIDTRSQITIESSISTFQRLTTLDQQKAFVEDILKNPPGDMTAQAARTLARSFQAEIGNTMSALRSERTDIKQDLAELTTILTKGGTPDPKKIAALEARASRLPAELQGDLRQDIANTQIVQGYIEAFRKMSPTMLQSSINQMAQGIDGFGGEGLDTLPEVKVLEAARSLLGTMNTQVERDPISWGVQTGLINFTPINLTSPEAAAESIGQRMADARRVSAVYGAPIKFLTDEEARAMSMLLNQRVDANGNESPRAQRMALLSGLVQNFGSYSADVLSELSDVDPQLGHVGGLVLIGQPSTASAAMAGMDLMKEGNNAIGLSGNDPKIQFAEISGSAFMLQSTARATGLKVAEAIYTKKALDQGLVEFDEGLWEKSIQLAFGYDERSGTGGLGEIRDKITLLPAGFTADRFEEVLETMTMDKLMSAYSLDNIDPGIVSQIQENKRIYPIVNNNGEYILVYEQDGTQRHFTNKNGAVIVIDMNKLMGAGR